MAKSKKAFVCKECGYESAKWIGQCPACNSWNSFTEIHLAKKGPASRKREQNYRAPQSLSHLEVQNDTRLNFCFDELNRVFGGGMVPGTVALLAGEPGIGKSTLVLQVLMSLKSTNALYASGEESLGQIRLRAERTAAINDSVLFTEETDVDNVLDQVRDTGATLVIIDSIQTMFQQDLDSPSGTVSQIRECASRIIQFAKSRAVSFLLIGHITKTGNIAGPMVLEHMVDVVLQFEGDSRHFYRMLRARKNRFGSVNEMGVFEMKADGLHEVANPSDMFIGSQRDDLSGVALGASVEGARPMMIEIQSLVSTAVFGTPQRTATGYDMRRMSMLLAVLEKRANIRISQKDVFVNIAGGLKVIDTGMDLPLIAAVLSSAYDKVLPAKSVFCGEMGLSGELRAVSRLEQRIKEAERMGFVKIFVPPLKKSGTSGRKNKIKVIEAGDLKDFTQKLFTS